MANDYAYEISADDETEELSIPASAVDALADDETPAEMGADLVLMGFLQQIHGAVHHSEGAADEALAAAESDLKETFEERFGIPFEQAIGHSH